MKLESFCSIPLPKGLDLPEEVFIGRGVARELPGVLSRYCGSGPVLLVADPNTYRAAAEIIQSLRDTNLTIVEELLDSFPHTDIETVERVKTAGETSKVSAMLAVGSGTINDITKQAAFELGIPYVVLGTAASMNGYASAVVAILENGVKTTRSATPPRAILLDTDLLLTAPVEMAQAGLGDLLSKPVSMADWRMASFLGETEFIPLAEQVVEEAVTQVTQQAHGIPAVDPQSYEALACAITLSGVSMVIAGSSAPASGGEHLISHFWDMEALEAGRSLRLHGAQVGVATLITSSLYRKILAVDVPRFVSPPRWEEKKAQICSELGSLAGLVLETAHKKHVRSTARVDRLRKTWEDLRQELIRCRIPGPPDLRQVLQRAGAAYRLADLGLGIEDAARALRFARDIRERITVLDIAFDLGILPEAVPEVLEQAGV